MKLQLLKICALSAFAFSAMIPTFVAAAPNPPAKPGPCTVKTSYDCALATYSMSPRDQKLAAVFAKDATGLNLKQATVLYMFRSSPSDAAAIYRNSEAYAQKNPGPSFREIQRVLSIWPADLSGERMYLLQLASRLSIANGDKFNLFEKEITTATPGPTQDLARIVAMQRAAEFEPHAGGLESAVDKMIAAEPKSDSKVLLLKHYESLQPDAAHRLAKNHRINLPAAKPVKAH